MGTLETKYNVLETIYRLAYALDALNYHETAKLFFPDRTFNFDIFAVLKKPAMDLTLPEYFKTATGSLGGFDSTQHVLSSPIITIDGNGKAHVKVMVTAFHHLMVDGKFEGMTIRVTWDFDLESHGEQWFITKWVLGVMVPMDRPDLMALAHERAHSGKLRATIVGP